MARIKVYDQNKKEWVYADKSFSKSPTTEIISLSDYSFTPSDGTTAPFDNVISVMMSKSLQYGENVQTLSGTDVDGSLFSAVMSSAFNTLVFLGNLSGGSGTMLWRPEMLYISDSNSELQMSFSSVVKIGGPVEVKFYVRLRSTNYAEIFLRSDRMTAT